MKEGIKKSLLAGLGAIDFSIEKVKQAVDALVERGELTRDQGKRVVDELVERGKKESSDLGKRIDEGVRKALDSITVITKPQYEKLEERVKALEAKVDSLGEKSSHE